MERVPGKAAFIVLFITPPRVVGGTGLLNEASRMQLVISEHFAFLILMFRPPLHCDRPHQV